VAEVAPRPVWGGRTTPITLGGGSTTPNKQNESGLTIPKSLGPKGKKKKKKKKNTDFYYHANPIVRQSYNSLLNSITLIIITEKCVFPLLYIRSINLYLCVGFKYF
jgi:hypothetical protein